MDLKDVVLLGIGALLGYYVVCHFRKTGQAA